MSGFITGSEMRKKSSGSLFIFWFPLLGYMAFIFYLSSGPAPEHIPDIRNIDKLLHFGAYGLLSILWFRALRSRWEKIGKRKLILLSFLFTSLYGISDEIHQSFVPQRNTSVGDLIADGLGAYLGSFIYSKKF